MRRALFPQMRVGDVLRATIKFCVGESPVDAQDVTVIWIRPDGHRVPGTPVQVDLGHYYADQVADAEGRWEVEWSHGGPRHMPELAARPAATKAVNVTRACPRCGDLGEWRAMAVVCRNGHGPFIGGPR